MKYIVYNIIAALLFANGCSQNPVAGGSGSETTNSITAVVVLPDGTPAVGATVRLRRKNFLSAVVQKQDKKGLVDKIDTVTDNTGRFIIDSVDTGDYFIEAFNKDSQAVLFSVKVTENVTGVDLPTGTLRSMATIAGVIDFAGDTTDGRVRIFGLDRHTQIDDSGSYSIMAPAGEKLALKVSSEYSKTKIVLEEALGPGEVEAVSYDFHTYVSDSIEVRAFLNNMGLANIDWDEVVGVEFGGIEELDLSDLGITQLHHSIGDLDFLTALFLDDNPLAELSEELLKLADLAELSLVGVLMNELPSVITKMVSLELLNLSDIGITELPWEFKELENLEALDVSENGLTEFPEVVLDCIYLEFLDLSVNVIPSIPTEIEALENLIELQINENALTMLPPEIGDLVYLEELGANDNQLVKLPDKIGNLENLTVLLIADNKLTTLPMSITDLTPSEELDVSGNPFVDLPQEIVEWIDIWSD